MWQEQRTNMSKRGGFYRLGKLHFAHLHAVACSTWNVANFLPVIEWLLTTCIVPKPESLQLCAAQSCIPNYPFIRLCCFRVSKVPEGACVPAVIVILCSLAGLILRSWVSSLCLWAQVPGGELNMAAGVLPLFLGRGITEFHPDSPWLPALCLTPKQDYID